MLDAPKSASRCWRAAHAAQPGLGMADVAGPEVSPEFVDDLSATCGDLLDVLDDRLREIALLRLQGFSNEEIAAQQDRSIKSIERYLKTIREIWQSLDSED